MGKGQKLRLRTEEDDETTTQTPRQLLESQDLFESSDATSDTTVWEEEAIPDMQPEEEALPLRRQGAVKKMPVPQPQ